MNNAFVDNLKMAAFLVFFCLLGILPGIRPDSNAGTSENNKNKAKHIILFIGDGMHLEHEIAASRYLSGADNDLVFHRFPYKTPVSTWDVTTYNALASDGLYDPGKIVPVTGYDPARGGEYPYPMNRILIDYSYFLDPLHATDSASAATAWATGFKTDEGNISWLPGDPVIGGNRKNDGSLTTVAEILRESLGYSIGIVSTVPFSHATPAAQVSHNRSRKNYYAIADEIIRIIQPEVVIGGGHPEWDPEYMASALLNDIRSGSIGAYEFAERKAGKDGTELLFSKAASAIKNNRKLFGLFGGAGGNFEHPVPADIPGFPYIKKATSENPLLRDATVAALNLLSKDDDGFFLMVEQGDIDWANHANDYKWMIGTLWDLNEAVKAAIDFVDQPADEITWDNTLLIVTSDHSNSLMRLIPETKTEKGDLPGQTAKPLDYPCPAHAYCGNYLYPDGDVTYGTGHHTNELVMLYATGSNSNLFKKYEGKWYPCTSIIDNTHIFYVITEAAGVPRQSPLTVNTELPGRCPKPLRTMH
jgi:alkaline phosphatase